jgi:hypothetical protein
MTSTNYRAPKLSIPDRLPAAIFALFAGSLSMALHARSAAAQPLASFEHHVVGVRLRVSPEDLYIPKSIPGSLAVDLVTGEGARPIDVENLALHTHVEAVLRGPAFPAYRLLGLPNEPLILPPLALVGEYQIDDIRLVDSATGDVRMMASPSRVSVHVFPEVLVSHVTSRPLSIDELQQRGIRIDASSFTAVEFVASFVIEGKTIPVRFPVVTPKFKPSTEIIPAAELEDRRVFAENMNRDIARALALPEELDLPGLNIQIEGLNFQKIAGGDDGKERDLPSIPGLLVIPGNIGFLNQYFSVQLFTSNAAPPGSNISVHTIRASIQLPTGEGPSAEDDPVALARLEDGTTTSVLPVASPGPDGLPGTSDDQGRLLPGQTGQAEFLVEGRKTGLHLLEITLDAILDGFAAGEVSIRGRAVGSVLIRNPTFSLSFAHPNTIRTGEPYTASLTAMPLTLHAAPREQGVFAHNCSS